MIRPDLASVYTVAKIVSRSPLITISDTTPEALLGLVTIAGDLMEGEPALHLLHPGWTLGEGYGAKIAAAVAEAQARVPQHKFLLLAPNDDEALRYRMHGEAAIVCSGLIFVDERIWRPFPISAGAPRFDAAYVARLDSFKRHELAAAVDRLLLIYSYPLENAPDVAVERIRSVTPNATFANHHLGGGQYAVLSNEQVAALLSQSDVGLCLSAIEGSMRASMEYMLCGLPIVSTRSVGGRDRYFVGSYCRIVDDDPDAIAFAVQELRAQNFDRARIRAHVGQIVTFERYNFLLTLNALVEKWLGVPNAFPTIDPFLGSLAIYESGSAIYEMLKTVLGTTGR